MRQLILILFMIFIIDACAAWGGKKPQYPERSLQSKMYHLCQDFEVEDPIGKVCNHWCPRKKCTQIDQFKLTIKDLRDPEVFKWFRAGGFVLIKEDQFL